MNTVSDDRMKKACDLLIGAFMCRKTEETQDLVPQKFCNRATKAFVALAHQMPSSFRNSWSRFTDSVLQRLIPRGVITEVVFTQSNHSRT